MKAFVIILAIIFIPLAIYVLPHWLIWSINELFETDLQHGFMNWLAALSLIVLASGGGNSK